MRFYLSFPTNNLCKVLYSYLDYLQTQVLTKREDKSKHSIHNTRLCDEQLPKEPNVSEADDFMQCQTQNKDGVAIVFGGETRTG